MASKRATVCKLYTSNHRTGLKFDPYSTLLFAGLYSEDGELRRGSEGQAKSATTPIPARATSAPKNCCGQLRVP